jgi:hypothetical protein
MQPSPKSLQSRMLDRITKQDLFQKAGEMALRVLHGRSLRA